MASLLRFAALAIFVALTLSGANSAQAQTAPAVEIRNGAVPGSLEIRASGVVALSSELIVERQLDNGEFRAVQNLDLGSLILTTSCAEKPGACIQVDERGLRPIAWTGMSCASQCQRICDKNERLFGVVRFVVTSCDGKTKYFGPLFKFNP